MQNDNDGPARLPTHARNAVLQVAKRVYSVHAADTQTFLGTYYAVSQADAIEQLIAEAQFSSVAECRALGFEFVVYD